MNIRMSLKGLTIFIAAFFPSLSWADSGCTEQNIDKIVDNLGYVDAPSRTADMECLAKYPAASAGLLIGQLKIVTDIKVTPEQASAHKETMHVIWSIRALRYLTGGMDFTAPSAESKKSVGRGRWGLLTVRDKQKLTFFGTRMSHDTVYLAPRDVQSDVITQWNDWYKESGKTFNYHAPSSNSDWYF